MEKIRKLKKTTITDKFERTIHLLSEHKQEVAKELIKELEFMRFLIDEMQREVGKTGATGIFQNGAQTNTRQTPEFRAYMDLSNRYNQYLKQLMSLYPAETVEESVNELDSFIQAGASL